MKSQQAIQMMGRCAEEIKNLRREINLLRPKAEAYDVIAKILGLVPGPNVGYGEDLVWLLEKTIQQEIEDQMPKEEADDRQ